MGFLNPTVPPVDPQEFLQRSLRERLRYLAAFWVDNGFGTPRVVHVIYLARCSSPSAGSWSSPSPPTSGRSGTSRRGGTRSWSTRS